MCRAGRPTLFLLSFFPVALLLSGLPGHRAEGQSILTVAGGGTEDGRPATAVAISAFDIAVSAGGDLYITEFSRHRVRRVDGRTGIVSTVAGNGSIGSPTDGLPATSTSITTPSAIALDEHGNLFIGDSNSHSILRVDALTGLIATYAGGGQAAEDGVPATAASLGSIEGIDLDGPGNLYVATASRVRMIAAGTGLITTIAGNGSTVWSGDGGPATQAGLYPRRLAVDRTGNVYVTSELLSCRVRRIDSATGIITTIAGNGTCRSSGDGGPATEAALDPADVAVDSGGNVYIADRGNSGNSAIRMVAAGSGVISSLASVGPGSLALGPDANIYYSSPASIGVLVRATGQTRVVAGNGTIDFLGDGGPATAAALSTPSDVAADPAGNLFIADTLHGRVRRVDARTGIVTTIAGTGILNGSDDDGPATLAAVYDPQGVVADAAGNVYIADTASQRIRKVDAAGVLSVAAGTAEATTGPDDPALLNPSSVSLDTGGGLYVADTGHYRVVRVDPARRTLTRVAGGSRVLSYGDGGPATAANLRGVWGVDVDGAGNLFIADLSGYRVRHVDARTGIITTIAGTGTRGFSGDGGPASAAQLQDPYDVLVDPSGNLYIADGTRVRRVDAATGTIQTVAGNGPGLDSGDGGPATQAGMTPRALARNGAGDLFIASGCRVRRVVAGTGVIGTFAGTGECGFSGDGGPATAAKLSTYLYGLALDELGDLYLSDTGTYRVRKVERDTGIIRTVAGNGSFGDSGDGGPAITAGLASPFALAADSGGNLFIAAGSRVRKIAAGTAVITTVAENGTYYGLAVDRTGNLYLSDRDRVREVDARGTITTVAGGASPVHITGDLGPATAASFQAPSDAVADEVGNVYVADRDDQRVRRVDGGTGIITTVAGTGTPGYSGDGGPATAARLSAPRALALDGRGGLLISDALNIRIRRLDLTTGVIDTVAGNGRGGFAGDGGPATAARLSYPRGISTDAQGNLLIADTEGNRIREVPACASVETPSLLTPSDGASLLPSSLNLTWSAARSAFRYDVLLDEVTPPARVAASDITGTSFVISNLKPGTTYRWRVIAKGDPFCVPFSSAGSALRTFQTAEGCPAPGAFALTAPLDQATVAAAPLLSWQAAPGASTYDVYLGLAGAASLVASGLSGTSFAAGALGPGASYSWYVVAHAACDSARTTASVSRAFKVQGSCTAAGAFAQTFPAAGATGVPSSTTLTWSASANASAYDLYLGRSSQDGPPLYLRDLGTTSAAVTGLSAGTRYDWKVVAKVSCGTDRSLVSPVSSFTVSGSCPIPGAPSIIFAPPGNVGSGQTYVVAWSAATDIDALGAYLVERSLAPSFSPLLDSQVTSATSASFVTRAEATIHHRVRAVQGCDPSKVSASSAVKTVAVVAGAPDVVFTIQPRAAVVPLGSKLEDARATFTLENLSASALTLRLSQSYLDNSNPFFKVVDPFGGDINNFSLEPRTPKTFEIVFSGPSTSEEGAYAGILYVFRGNLTPLAITPYAFVNLRIGAEETATPQFLVNGAPSEYVPFPGFPAPGDAGRPSIAVDIRNPGTTPMELGGEVGPEVWLLPEAGWNARAIPPGASRTVRLRTQRDLAPDGSALPRYTYFTVRTKTGQSARLLVQDNDKPVLGTGRPSLPSRATRSYLIPSVVRGTSAIGNTFVSRLRLSNVGNAPVEADLLFAPAGADGFEASSLSRATVLVPPNDVVTLTDPLVQLFGLTPPVSGSLEVRATPERIGFLTVTSSVDAPAAGGGTFGFQLPTVVRGEGARLGQPHVVAGITAGTDYRTNLILAETTGVDRAAVRTTLFDRNGTRKGDTVLDVPRYGQVQVSGVVARLSGEASLEAGQIELSVESGGGSVVGLVTVIDNTNDDAVTYVSRPQAGVGPGALARFQRRSRQALAGSTQSLMIPAVVNGYPTFRGRSDLPYTFRSLLGLVSPGLISATFTMRYQDLATGLTTTRTETVGPRRTKEFKNVLEELFGVPPGQQSQGPIFVDVAGNGLIYCKVYSNLEKGSLGDGFPVVPVPYQALTGAGSAKPVYVDGLEQSVDETRGTRSNLILNEVSGQPLIVSISLYEAGNRLQPIATKSVTLGPLEKKQLSDVFQGLDLSTDQRRKDRTNVLCVVEPVSGAGLVSAVVTTIDNRTGDTRNTLLTPTGGVEATGGGSIGF